MTDIRQKDKRVRSDRQKRETALTDRQTDRQTDKSEREIRQTREGGTRRRICASLYKFFSFCLQNILTLTPWSDWTDRQTDKRQRSGRQTSQKEVDHMDRKTDKRERKRSVIQTRKRQIRHRDKKER